MSKFKGMKFKVDSPAHSERIQRALFAMGYSWYCNTADVKHIAEKYLLAERDGYILYGSHDFEFKNSCNEEYVITLTGLIVPANSVYQASIPPYTITIPTVGLTPKYIKDALRTQEILEAMLRFSKAGKDIPFAWQNELWQLLGSKREEEETK